MFCHDARKYIAKLIKMQGYITAHGYRRADHAAVIASMAHLANYMAYYTYDTNEKMSRFFIANSDHIRRLIPHVNYPGHKKLNAQFNELINQCTCQKPKNQPTRNLQISGF